MYGGYYNYEFCIVRVGNRYRTRCDFFKNSKKTQKPRSNYVVDETELTRIGEFNV